MADVMKEDDEKSEDLVIVEDKNKLTEPEDDEADEKVVKSKEDDEDHPDNSEAEREAIRERRRLEKLERKERRDKAITRDKTELEFLRKRNDELERRMSAQEQRAHQVDLQGLAAQAAQAKKEAEMAERVIAKAVEAGNGEDVTKAMRYRDQALQKLNQLTFAQQQAQRQAQAPQGNDEQVTKMAQRFLSEHKWYDPEGKDEDSAIVLAIDQTLMRDGYDPKTEDYWDELKHRAARRLPERFGKTESKREERESRGGPALGSGREHAPASTRKEVYVSPERKQALIDAGVWDDPILRMKYVKRYAEYDRANRA